MFNYKDRFPVSCRSMAVYGICCKKCGPSQAYIGKTVNTLYERFHASGSGHLHPNNVESAFLNHFNSSGDPDRAFHFDDVTVLDCTVYNVCKCKLYSVHLHTSVNCTVYNVYKCKLYSV